MFTLHRAVFLADDEVIEVRRHELHGVIVPALRVLRDRKTSDHEREPENAVTVFVCASWPSRSSINSNAGTSTEPLSDKSASTRNCCLAGTTDGAVTFSSASVGGPESDPNPIPYTGTDRSSSAETALVLSVLSFASPSVSAMIATGASASPVAAWKSAPARLVRLPSAAAVLRSSAVAGLADSAKSHGRIFQCCRSSAGASFVPR